MNNIENKVIEKIHLSSDYDYVEITVACNDTDEGNGILWLEQDLSDIEIKELAQKTTSIENVLSEYLDDIENYNIFIESILAFNDSNNSIDIEVLDENINNLADLIQYFENKGIEVNIRVTSYVTH